MEELRFCIAGLKIKVCSELTIQKLNGLEPFIRSDFDKGDENVIYYLNDLDYRTQDSINDGKILYSDSKITYCVLDGEYYRIIKIFTKYSYVKFNSFDLSRIEIYAPLKEWNMLPVLKDLLCFDLPLLQYDGIQIHASFVKYQGRAVLFSAPSGTGKSTQASLWERHRNGRIINGDKTLLRRVEGRWCAYGSPWAGTSHIYINDYAENPVVFIVKQSKENKIIPVSGKNAVALLLSEAQAQCWRSEYAEKICTLLESFVSQCDVCILECRPDSGAVEIVHQFLLKREI